MAGVGGAVLGGWLERWVVRGLSTPRNAHLQLLDKGMGKPRNQVGEQSFRTPAREPGTHPAETLPVTWVLSRH